MTTMPKKTFNNNARAVANVNAYESKKKNNTTPYIIEIDGLCEMLNIGKNTAYGLLTSGEIDSFKVGSVWKIPMSSLNEYIERKCEESKRVPMYKVINKNRDLYFERHGDLPIRY